MKEEYIETIKPSYTRYDVYLVTDDNGEEHVEYRMQHLEPWELDQFWADKDRERKRKALSIIIPVMVILGFIVLIFICR